MSRYEIKSDVTGTVWKIEKKIGDKVVEGDEILILESMKMEIPAIATGAGTLTEILVEEETSVEEGQTVAIVEG
jgi:acetyl-CoA carboxylase biotin carboxyl carrier protein